MKKLLSKNGLIYTLSALCLVLVCYIVFSGMVNKDYVIYKQQQQIKQTQTLIYQLQFSDRVNEILVALGYQVREKVDLKGTKPTKPDSSK